MGRSYATELAQLRETYEWACHHDISILRQAILRAGSLPLLAIGSGGSLTAAHFITGLHRRYTGKIASVATPLEAILEPLDGHVAIWLLSAGGGNVDINTSFMTLVNREPAQLGVICGRKDSPLVMKAREHCYVDLFDFALPVERDGFLATNSLLAFCLLIARAYAGAYGKSEIRISGLVPESTIVGLDSMVLSHWREVVEPIWERETTIILHGAASRTGAIDLESKFTEAALGNLQIADYRNFAHGRHHWLAKRGKTSGIIAFITPEDHDLAEKTLALIPKEIPMARIELAGDYLAVSLGSLVASLHVCGWAGIARGIDPGRPGVPVFGRKIYNLVLPKEQKSPAAIPPDEAIAIERKAGVQISRLLERGDLPQWRSAIATFKKSLALAKLSAVVFDYDGTIVDTRTRFDLPSQQVVSELIRILKAGLIIGIATGRGASIRRDLQQCLPHSLWKLVIIGYYNGAVISSLEDDNSPHGNNKAGKELAQLSAALRCHSELREIAEQEDRQWQITLQPRQYVPEDRLWDIANQIIQLKGLSEISVVRSSHSIDILAPKVSKRCLIDYITNVCLHGDKGGILRIGDRGRWPGNDFELLSDSHSLSVDESSIDPSTCWNLAQRGQRGVQATLSYCRALQKVPGGGVRFVLREKGIHS